MSLKKWLFAFFAALLGCVALFAAYNALVDPFGVFGDRLFDWYEYDMTQNPRVAKLAYLDRHHEEYDSYVIGSSKASSLSVDTLNRYTGDHWYNMTWYGADYQDNEQFVDYILENYQVKNIILTVDPECGELYATQGDDMKLNMHAEADGSSKLLFYGKYLFCNPSYALDKIQAWFRRDYLLNGDTCYVADTGCYNKQLRDAIAIGDMETYMETVTEFSEGVWAHSMPHTDEMIASLQHIQAACEEAGVELTVIGVPVSQQEFFSYTQEDVSDFWRKLAQCTDFYEFWGNNTVNCDERYFYDYEHFRNCAGDMVLAYIFGDDSVYVPEDFGHVTTAENVEQRIAETYSGEETAETDYTAKVPILMYHSFTSSASETDYTTVTVERFAEQIAALAEAGYTPLFYQDLIDYVYEGKELPEKPILITFDDGYADNLELAVPVLEEYGFKATVSVIGISAGKDTYKDSGVSITPHFALEDAAEYVEAGTLDIQTHSYDMHQEAELDGEDCRSGVLRQEGESQRAYVTALARDFAKAQTRLEDALGLRCTVYTYPEGLWDTLSEVVLHRLGVQVTVTTEYGTNTLVKGIPQSLYQLRRINVDNSVEADDLLWYLEQLENDNS